MPPILYHVPRTISSPLVQIALELGLIDEGKLLVREMSFAELKSPEHLALNIMGTSPAFQCTKMGLCMRESGAILDFLLERFDPEHKFHPAPTTVDSTAEECRTRTKYLQLKQFIIATVYPFIASMYIHSLQSPGGKLDEEYMESAKKKCHACMGPALAMALGDGPYFLGDQISAIDFLAAKPLGNAHALGLLDEAPPLIELLERIKERPSYVMAYEGGLSQGSEELAPLVSEPDDQELVLVPKRRSHDTEEEKENDNRKARIPNMDDERLVEI